MLGLEKVADWWDKQKSISEDALDEFVHEHPNWFGITVATAVGTSMVLGQGFVDVLRVGEGVKEGGWGYGKDALRVLALAGPIAKASRLGLAKLTPNPSGGYCAWVSSAQALRRTGNKHFATVFDLMVTSGKTAAPTNMSQMISVLKQVGARTRNLGQARNFKELARLTKRNPDSVVLFAVRWLNPKNNQASGHALYAFRDALGRFRIADRSGVTAKSLTELERLVLKKLGGTYRGISNAELMGNLVAVDQAGIVQGINLASVLAVEVRTAVLVDEKTATNEFKRIRAVKQGPKSGEKVHTVVRGDSLSKIAKQYYGSFNRWKKLYELNVGVVGANPNLIYPGQKLLIPKQL